MSHPLCPFRMVSAALRLALLALLVQPVTAQTPSIDDGEPETRTVSFTTTEGTALGFDISSDGKTIVFDLLGQLWTLPAEGGEAVPLTDAGTDVAEDLDPVFSPDGKWIVFQGDRRGEEGLWMIPAEGGEPRLLSGTEFRRNIRWKTPRHPAWSPDGRQIVFSTERRTIPSPGWEPSDGGLHVYDIDSDTATRLEVESPPDGALIEPSWLAGGRILARVAGEGFWLIDPETGHSEAVPTGELSPVHISAAPVGYSVAFFALDEEGAYQLWMQSVDGGEATQLSRPGDIAERIGWNPPARPAWARDGSALLYATEGRIWRMPVDGGERREIPFTARITIELEERKLPHVNFPEPGSVVSARGHMGLALSPDGEQIALIALGRLWLWEIGAEPQAIANLPPSAAVLSWSPDGSAVAWNAGSGGGEDIYITDLGTGQARQLTALPGRAYRPSWSPDGQQIAFLYWPRPAFPLSDDADHQKVHLAVIPAIGVSEPISNPSQLQILAEMPGNWVHGMQPMGQDLPAWSPPGDALLYYDGLEELRIIPLEVEPMTVTAIHGPMTFVQWAADSSLVYVQGAQLWRTEMLDGVLTEPVLLMEEAALYPSLAWDGSILFIGASGYGLRRAGGNVEDLGWPLTYELPVPEPLLIRNANIVDGTGAAPAGTSDLFIERGRIVRIEAAGSINPEAGMKVIDAGGRTLLPGLIDLHMHGWDDLAYLASLYHGVTTVREMGAPIARMAALGDAAAGGHQPGPRVVLGGFHINPGSHINFSGATLQNTRDPDARDRAFSLAEAFGASFVKMQFPGTWLAGAELISEAHTRGLRVAGHCAHPLPLIAAGVKQVEHISACFPMRSWAQPQSDFIQLYREAGVAAIPTMAVISATVATETDPTLGDDPGLAPFLSPSLRLWGGYHEASASDDHWGLPYMRRGGEAVSTLHEVGIRIGTGTDAPNLPGAIHLEMEDLFRSGLTPMEVIVAATYNAAKILGAEEEIGTIKVGKWADLIILNEDPLEDIRNTREIWKVIKGGEIVDREGILEWAKQKVDNKNE